MIVQSTRRNVACDGCGYLIDGLYADLSNRDKHDVSVLDRWGETFHFHAGTDRDCLAYFQANARVRVRAMMEREAARAYADAETDADAYMRDERADLERRFADLVADVPSPRRS